MPNQPIATVTEFYRERHFSAQDGLQIFFRDYGDPLSAALPILCLPGLTRNGLDFESLALRLAPERRVLCPDYRGRGRSQYDRNKRNYTPRTDINDMVHLLAATNTQRAVIIGSSFGGLLAMALAVAVPTAVAGLVINDIGPDLNAPEMTRLLAVLSTDRPQPNWDAAIGLAKDMFPTLAFRDPGTWRRMARNTFREGADGLLHFDWDVAVPRAMREGGALPDLWPLFRAVARLPVLAVRGENSTLLSPACFDRMAAAKPDLVRLTVAGAGHTPTLEEPEARVAIDAFLEAL